MLNLIDRRLNGRNKSAANRERFLRRFKDQIKKSVQDMVGERSITDMGKGGKVNIPVKDISEPQFHHAAGGDREVVFPGNRQFVKGDTIKRQGGGSGGGGNDGDPGEGEGADDFVFSLSREEFLDLFFDDLALPHLLRSSFAQVVERKWLNAGYVSEGVPCNLAVGRTLKTALGRRIALTSAIRRQLEEARARLEQANLDALPAAAIEALEGEVAQLKARLARVPFLDELDLRYRNRVSVPAPVARAVMFCLMDVSASMDEARKDLAKRFFTLLYMFLSRKYEQVGLVFIRHTDDAEEVDEKTFFHDTGSGGTVVLAALELAHRIATERYADSGWNVYVAQASDGDAFGADAGKSARFVEENLLPLLRYFAYIEVRNAGDMRDSNLWASYETLKRENFSMRHVGERGEIYPAFRDLFKKENA